MSQPLVSSAEKSSLAGWYERHRRKIYPVLVLLIYVCWITYMTVSQKWSLFLDYWPATLTMMLGSFVAGATAEGGGAVAYPVFTKVLHIASTDARTFALMIQSFGMGMASLFIVTRRIHIMPRVVFWVSLGGLIGHVVGAFYVVIPSPYPKVLFTFVTSAFGVALFLSTYIMKAAPRPDVPNWSARHQALFWGVGIFGGIFASQVGSGIDAVTFMVLTLAFGVNEKISTPTTVLIMAINSWVGFFLHGAVLQDIDPMMWNYWLVAVQIVIIGAPLGAFVTSKVHRHVVINFLLFLISLELITTLLLVPFETLTQVAITVTAVLSFALAFWLMLRYRRTLPAPDLSVSLSAHS